MFGKVRFNRWTYSADGGEIIDIKVNADLTKGILIGKGYVYCFSTPGGINHRATSSSDILENKIADSTQEHRIDCKSVIHGSIKEEQFKGFVLSKIIVSFDFGPCFVDKNYVTIFAVDNESEIYYASLSTLSSSIKVNPIIGPVCFKNVNINLEPMDMTFLKHPHADLLSLKLFQPAPTTSPSNLYTNEETFITAAPLPADIPKIKNDTNLSYENSLILFSEIFEKLIDLASNNVALTHDVIKKSEAISTLNDKLQLINFFTVLN
uniref:Uncharacterized protein n=1 Tax=Panagrolaimus davidi TaxID=227884 RepID=A0A914QP14_9BILA